MRKPRYVQTAYDLFDVRVEETHPRADGTMIVAKRRRISRSGRNLTDVRSQTVHHFLATFAQHGWASTCAVTPLGCGTDQLVVHLHTVSLQCWMPEASSGPL